MGFASGVPAEIRRSPIYWSGSILPRQFAPEALLGVRWSKAQRMPRNAWHWSPRRRGAMRKTAHPSSTGRNCRLSWVSAANLRQFAIPSVICAHKQPGAASKSSWYASARMPLRYRRASSTDSSRRTLRRFQRIPPWRSLMRRGYDVPPRPWSRFQKTIVSRNRSGPRP